MDYNIGDVIKLRNDAGVFKVKIMHKIDTNDATRGFGDDMRFDGRMRLEVHNGGCYQYIIMLTERGECDATGKVILCCLDGMNDEIEYYLGSIIQYEQPEDVFELMK